MSIVRVAALALCASMLAACAAPQQMALATPSGRPEVVIPKVQKKQVIDAIVAYKLGMGMQVKSVNDYGVTVSKRMEGNLGASIAYGSRYDGIPEARITYNTVEVPEGVRVFSNVLMVTNPGSAYERVNDLTQASAVEMQTELETIRANLLR